MYGPDGLEPQPLEDLERVDEIRSGVGLGPLEQYREQIVRHNSTPPAGGSQVGRPPPRPTRSPETT
jgi:hypothetical protein